MANDENRTTTHAAAAAARGRGFTLTEVLIVIGIIVLVLALAVPALNVITGSRSIDGAENNISAMLGRARADAVGVQRITGIMFFIDRATERVTLAQVRNVTDATIEPIVLELVPDRDFLALPKGILSQTVDSTVVGGTGRADDGYIGFNQTLGPGLTSFTPYGGAVLFDGKGQLVSKAYVFERRKDISTTSTPVWAFSDIYKLLMTGNIVDLPGDDPASGANVVTPPGTPLSQFGFVLYQRDEFVENWNLEDVQITGVGTYATAERAEELWLDENATPLMVNRYNGTLIRGE